MVAAHFYDQIDQAMSIDCCTARQQQAWPPFDPYPQQHGAQQQMRAVQWRRSWRSGGSKDPHFPEWGVTYKAVTASFDAMLMSLFSLYILVVDGDGCR